jgi:hypothetical protein
MPPVAEIPKTLRDDCAPRDASSLSWLNRTLLDGPAGKSRTQESRSLTMGFPDAKEQEMELTNDQVALLAGLGAVAASILLMTLSYYLGQSARRRQAEIGEQGVKIHGAPAAPARRSKAA